MSLALGLYPQTYLNSPSGEWYTFLWSLMSKGLEVGQSEAPQKEGSMPRLQHVEVSVGGLGCAGLQC